MEDPVELADAIVPASAEQTSLVVVFFDDMKGSTVLKEQMAAASDEQAFQMLRKEHDALVTEVITRDGAGEVLKSTGDGVLAVLYKPSVAVERALEIQERLHTHPHLKVRIGMDMGEVSMESGGLNLRDAFGRHVDWAARAMELAEAGHICVTRAVYTDAFSWIGKRRIAWKEHGPHRVKDGDPPLEIFEPHNANIVAPLERLRGVKVEAEVPETTTQWPASLAHPDAVHVARSWEAVARDGRDFASGGAGMMYWFKVPLGGISYPEGFRNFLQPALENPNVGKIRFLLDQSSPLIPKVWAELVLPQVERWANDLGVPYKLEPEDWCGHFEAEGERKTSLGWVFGDLSQEYTPCFKLFVADPDTDHPTAAEAQIFLATVQRTVRFADGSMQQVRIPDAVLRVKEEGNAGLLQALNVVANQWDAMFR
ncbi:MAG TPA: adenylate/guanylate cyclase domain-containing protein [Actinomycetota bacterium]